MLSIFLPFFTFYAVRPSTMWCTRYPPPRAFMENIRMPPARPAPMSVGHTDCGSGSIGLANIALGLTATVNSTCDGSHAAVLTDGGYPCHEGNSGYWQSCPEPFQWVHLTLSTPQCVRSIRIWSPCGVRSGGVGGARAEVRTSDGWRPCGTAPAPDIASGASFEFTCAELGSEGRVARADAVAFSLSELEIFAEGRSLTAGSRGVSRANGAGRGSLNNNNSSQDTRGLPSPPPPHFPWTRPLDGPLSRSLSNALNAREPKASQPVGKAVGEGAGARRLGRRRIPGLCNAPPPPALGHAREWRHNTHTTDTRGARAEME